MVSTAVHPINHSTHPWKFRAKDGLPKNTLLLRTPSGAVINAVAGGMHFIPYAISTDLPPPQLVYRGPVSASRSHTLVADLTINMNADDCKRSL